MAIKKLPANIAFAAPATPITIRWRAALAEPPLAMTASNPPNAKPHVQKKTCSAITSSVLPSSRPRSSRADVTAIETNAESAK